MFFIWLRLASFGSSPLLLPQPSSSRAEQVIERDVVESQILLQALGLCHLEQVTLGLSFFVLEVTQEFRPGLHFGTIDILGRISLSRWDVLCTVRCLAASLASTLQIPLINLPFSPSCDTKKFLRTLSLQGELHWLAGNH
uniref:Uncharacterized protein n=1 Tax=Molossus molossus TaxID=27622 RepID=A0A7J8J8P2_MOLMO|nr:hypothetical protein HJG59_009700 [Molossus molossus]